MTTIGVISDTHSLDVPQSVLDVLAKTDLIIHAGDFCDISDVQAIQKLGKLEAVYGNMDGNDVRSKLPERHIFQCEDVKIGILHGAGRGSDVIDFVDLIFSDDDVDLIIFGHTHTPHKEERKGKLFFNPGSPNDFVRAPYRSYGLIKIDGHHIDAEIVKVE